MPPYCVKRRGDDGVGSVVGRDVGGHHHGVGVRVGVRVGVGLAVDVGGGRLGPFAVTVDEHESGALAGERDRGGASVADGRTGGLTRADDDGHASFELAGHDVPPFEASPPSVAHPVWRIGEWEDREDRDDPCLSRRS